MTTDFDDPYADLGVDQDADQETLAAAYRRLRRQADIDPGRLNNAYGRVRDADSRLRFSADWPAAILAPLPERPTAAEMSEQEVRELVRELAFLSDWELGDD